MVVYIKFPSEICPVCGDKYKLKNHMASKHHGFQKDFKCDLCNVTFLSARGLERHKYTCSEKSKLSCDKCHKIGNAFDRDQCDKQFLHKTSLNEHKL